MHTRKLINRLLQSRGYQIVKTSRFEPSFFQRPGAEIEIDDEVIASRVAPDRKHVWLVAPPKSGSNWLTALLAQLLQWPLVPLVYGHDRREQEVDRRPILRYPKTNIISPQQHCRASQPTLEFIEECRVLPIVQTRNIFDSVVSFRDHLLGDVIMPMAYADGQFAQLPEERQYDFVIDLALPWYFNFYASWFSKAESSPNLLLFISYEDLVRDTAGALRKVLQFIQEERSEAEIDQATLQAGTMGTRKNKGVVGRGDCLLNERQKAKIRNFRQYYPQIDFSPIGL